MSAYTKNKTITQLKETGIVPVFYHPNLDVCRGVLKAAYDAGIKVFEFTNRGENAYELFIELRHFVSNQLPGMILGVGSIIDADTTTKFVIAGADFIVSPIFKPEMSEVCMRHNIPWMPGCMTATEIVNASQAGADIIKLFPGASLGPKFVAAVLGPLPWLKLMPTGGVEPTEQNLSEWFQSGVVCVGIGGQLFNKDLLAKQDFEAITKDMAKALAMANKVRGLN